MASNTNESVHSGMSSQVTKVPKSGDSSRRGSTLCESDCRSTKEKFDSREGSIQEDEDQSDDFEPREQPPYHVFGPRIKVFVVSIVSAAAAMSGLATYTFLPSVEAISKDLAVSRELVNLSITTYILAQGIGPSLWGPLSDHQGRRTTLLYTLALFVGSNVAIALSTNGAMLMVFRALQALGSASTISLGSGVIADIAQPSERGGYIGWFSGVRQLSLGLGPVIGGVLAQYLGWRSVFWFLVILSAVTVLLLFLVLPETLRRIAGNGSTPLESWLYRPALWSFIRKSRHLPADEESTIRASQAELKPATPLTAGLFFGPFLFLLEKDVFCALLFGSCVYTSWSMMIASTTYLFADHYDFDTLQIGLCFLANGFGCVAGSILAGKSLNFDFYREARLWQHERGIPVTAPLPSKPIPASFPLERARLNRGPLYCLVAIWSLLLFGWSLTTHRGSFHASTAHWITPLLAEFACGWSATSVLTCNNSLVVDLYPGKSASASAVLNLSRSLMAAGGIAATEPLLASVGAGWTSVVLVGIVTFGLLPYAAHSRWGSQWREQREKRLDSPR